MSTVPPSAEMLQFVEWSETSVPGTPSLIEQTFWVWLLITVSPVTPYILLTSFSQAVRLARLRRNHRFPNCICACTEGKLKYRLVRSVQMMENVSLHSVLVWALQFVPGSFLVPEDRKINCGFVWMGIWQSKSREKEIHYIYLCKHFLKWFLQFHISSSLHEHIYPGWLYLGFIEKACSYIYSVRLELFIGADQSIQTLLTVFCSEPWHHALFSMAV